MFDTNPDRSSDRDRLRPFISVHLRCCNVYQRVYVNSTGDAFVGWCLKCATQVRVPIVARGGTTNRTFSAF